MLLCGHTVCNAQVTEEMKSVTRQAWAAVKAKDFDGAYAILKDHLTDETLVESGAALSLARVYEEGCGALHRDRDKARRLYLSLVYGCPNKSIVEASCKFLEIMETEDDMAVVGQMVRDTDVSVATAEQLRALGFYSQYNIADGYDQAERYYRVAVDRYGDAESMHRLSLLYYIRARDAILQLKDPAEYLRQAAALMVRGAETSEYLPLKYNAAIVCLYGIGTKRDARLAQKFNTEFISLASQLGNGYDFHKDDYIAVPRIRVRWAEALDGTEFRDLMANSADASGYLDSAVRYQQREDYGEAHRHFLLANLSHHPLAGFYLKTYDN